MSQQHRTDDTVVLTPASLRELAIDGGSEDDGKDGRGTVLVVAGTAGTPGAALLAGVAALRAGAGKLQIAVPASVAAHIGIAVPECACVALPQTAAGEIDPLAADQIADLANSADAVLVGPGLTGLPAVPDLVRRLLPLLTDPRVVVVDAKAVEALEPEIAASLDGRLLLTPNAAEAGALLDDAPLVERDPLAAARLLADRFAATVALRGAVSWIACADRTAYRNEAGNNGLGTSGSGDVCSGAVAGFAARGADPVAAAAWGVYAHARAGDRLLTRVGRTGFLAREIADELPAVLTELEAG